MAHSSVLITGADGFIGRHLAKEAARRGARVHGLVRKPPKHPLPGVRYHLGSILDRGAVDQAVRRTRPAGVFHLAGKTGRDDPDLFRVNVGGTANLLAALARTRARIVFASTCEVYGRREAPFRETQAADPLSRYAQSKEAAERLLLWWARQTGNPVTILRLSVVYGPGQGRGMFLADLAAAARAGRSFPMTGGRQLRDFLHVDDAARALLAAATTRRAIGRTLNVGYGRSVSLRAAGDLAQALAGTSFVRPGALPYRKGEIRRYAVDIKRARRILHWRPRVTLEEGLRDLLAR